MAMRDVTDNLNNVKGYASKKRASIAMTALLDTIDEEIVSFVTRNDNDRWVIVVIVTDKTLQICINATHMNNNLIAIGG